MADFLNTIFVSSHMYPENPEGTQVIVGSMNMGYISDIARNRTRNLFRPKREPIPLGHSDGHAFNEHSNNFSDKLTTSWTIALQCNANLRNTILYNNIHYTSFSILVDGAPAVLPQWTDNVVPIDTNSSNDVIPVILIQNMEAVLTCNARRFMNITWYKDGEPLARRQLGKVRTSTVQYTGNFCNKR